MPQSIPEYKRKYYFVKKDFQFSIILKFCLLLLIGAAISTGLLLLFSQDTLTSTFRDSRLEIRTTASVILPAIIYTNLITLALITVATIIVTLFISHKLAGPLFRFEKELREIGEGNLSKNICLRKDDQMITLCEDMNRMSECLRGKLLTICDDLGEITRRASERKENEELVSELGKLRLKINSEFKLQ
jgi:methyl-accepting chemotaxis protein